MHFCSLFCYTFRAVRSRTPKKLQFKKYKIMNNEVNRAFTAKKILFVIDTYQTNNNGTSISAQRYAAQLRERGHEVRILCADEEPAADKYILQERHHYPFDGLVHKHGFRFAQPDEQIIRQAVEWSDIVHCFMPFPLTSATKKIADRLGKPATAAFHIQPENITSSISLGKVSWVNNAIYRGFREAIYDKFTHVHTPSQFMANEIISRNYKAKMHPISNGIQEAFMEAGESKLRVESLKLREVGKSKVDSSKKVFKIMMIGRLSQEKRQDVIINAVKYSKYADRIQLVFAGRGPEYDKYVELGKDLKHQPQFIYVGRDELIENLLDTDLYVHASDMESEAISCIEAFATGLVPVIANSHVSATPQFAIDGRSLFIPGDPKDLARAIDYWLDHPGERKFMEEQYRLAGRKYSLESSVAQFEEMLNAEIQEHETNTIHRGGADMDIRVARSRYRIASFR